MSSRALPSTSVFSGSFADLCVSALQPSMIVEVEGGSGPEAESWKATLGDSVYGRLSRRCSCDSFNRERERENERIETQHERRVQTIKTFGQEHV